LLGLCLSAGTVLAADPPSDESSDTVADEVITDVVEERAGADADAKPEDADVGEASYNTADCADAMPEQGESEEVGDAVEAVDMDAECEQVVK